MIGYLEMPPIETPPEPTKDHTELKVGDKVRIKSLEWYEENKDSTGNVNVPLTFVPSMAKYCGRVFEIGGISKGYIYCLKEDLENWSFSKEMFDLD